MAETINRSFVEYLQEEIRHRFSEKSELGSDNVFIHRIFDLDSNDPDEVKKVLQKNGIVFNPNLAFLNPGIADVCNQDLSSDELYPSYLLTDGFTNYMTGAGISKTYFKDLPFASSVLKNYFKASGSKSIPAKDLEIVMIGFGGAMSNILWNLTILQDVFDARPLFKNLSIYEKDNWALTNIFRVGKQVMHKAFSRFQTRGNVVSKLDTIDKEFDLSDSTTLVRDYLSKDEIDKIIENNPDTIFIGAPDFSTRKYLAEKGANFIMVGHSGNSIRITKCPNISEGVVETYGSIDTPVLLLNLWVATYKLIELFSNPEKIYNAENGEELFEFDYNQLSKKKKNEIKKGFEWKEEIVEDEEGSKEITEAKNDSSEERFFCSM